MQWPRILVLAAAFGASWPAMADVLEVGPDRAFRQPSEGIAAALRGDVVRIAPGEYFDCAIVKQDGLTILGSGPETILTDKTCAGKAILVIEGNDVTVRDLTLRRARVPDHNGAGIRAEATNLVIDHVGFIDNENGILAGDAPGSTIRVVNSEFRHNGRCLVSCAHGIYVGRVALLHIQHSRVADTQAGNAIRSWADRTEILDNDIADTLTGTTSILVNLPGGGDLLMWDNRLQKGPKASGNRVVSIGEEQRGSNMATQIIRNNTLTDDGAGVTALVLNWGAADPVVTGNTLPAGVAPLSTSGALAHRIHGGLYATKVSLLNLLNFAKRGVRKILSIL